MAQEGEVRQHPNGGTYKREGGVWVLQGAAPAPASPVGVVATIPGNPAPKPKYRTLSEPERVSAGLPQGIYQISPEGKVDPVSGTTSEKPKDPVKERSGQILQDLQADNVLQAVRRAEAQIQEGDAAGNFKGSKFYQSVPWVGQNSANLAATLSGIQGSVINDTIKQLKELSATGASGYGSLTETEADRLAASVAALQQTQSPEELKTSLLNVEKHYRRAKALLNGDDPRLPEVAQRYGIIEPRAVQGATVAEDAGGIKGFRLPPDAEKQYLALIQRNPPPSAEEMAAFLRRYGAQDENAGEIAEAMGKGGAAPSAVSYSKADEMARAAAEEEMRRQDERYGPTPVGETLLVSGMSLGLSDEAAGIGRGISKALQLENPIEGYRLGRDAERLRQEQARTKSGWGGTGLEIVGGVLSANPTAAIAPLTSRAATIANGARSGAIGGALGGYGYGEGVEGSAAGALLGAGGGAALGAGISALGSRNRTFSDRTRQDAADVLDAANRQDIPVNAANVRPGARNMLSYLEATPGSSGPVQRNLAAQGRAIEERAGALSRGGTALDNQAAGETVRGGFERSTQRMRDRAVALYDRAAEKAKVAGTSTVAKGQLAEFRREGNERFLLYDTPSGKSVEMHVILGKDGMAEISVSPFSKASNSLGITHVRDAAAQLKALYPEVRQVWGARQSGANPGRLQRVDLKATEKAGDLKFTGTTAIQRIRSRIAELSETPETNSARIDALKNVLSDLVQPDGTPRPISVQGMRNIRTGTRDRIQSLNLRGSAAETDVLEAINGISDDIAAGLRERAPDASRLYERADQLWRQRKQIEQDIVQRIAGREGEKSSEQIFTRLQTMATPRGDGARLREAMRLLSPEERGDIAATVAENLGRRGPEEPFSPALFVSQARRLSPQARNLFFGREGAQTVEDLRRVAQSYVETVGKLNNSGSGRVSNYRAFFGQMFGIGGLGGSAGAVIGGPAGGVVGTGVGMMAGATVNGAAVAARNLTARLMMFRPFVRWLSRAPRNDNPEAVQAHIRRLGAMGRDTPVATDLQQLQQTLQSQFAPSAASGGEEEEQR